MIKASLFTLVLLCATLAATAREGQEWLTITSFDGNSTNLPRVLLIGDSITSRYSGEVRKNLKDKAYLSVMATSKAVGDPALLDEIKTILSQYQFAVVHFNIGLHGFTPDAYRKGFPEMLETIKKYAPGAKLIWATTTPCQGEEKSWSSRKRNEIADELIKKANIPVDDLYALVMSNTNNPAVLWDGGGVHFTEAGAALQGKQVADSILKLLPQ
ncbi:MAG: SGNH/GDSL hydrolase family protein [Kiritimatiellia bacterium]